MDIEWIEHNKKLALVFTFLGALAFIYGSNAIDFFAGIFLLSLGAALYVINK